MFVSITLVAVCGSLASQAEEARKVFISSLFCQWVTTITMRLWRAQMQSPLDVIHLFSSPFLLLLGGFTMAFPSFLFSCWSFWGSISFWMNKKVTDRLGCQSMLGTQKAGEMGSRRQLSHGCWGKGGSWGSGKGESLLDLWLHRVLFLGWGRKKLVMSGCLGMGLRQGPFPRVLTSVFWKLSSVPPLLSFLGQMPSFSTSLSQNSVSFKTWAG